MVEIARCQGGQTGGEALGRVMGQATQHDMRHGIELTLDRINDVRVPIAVAHRPPGRDAVDQLAPVSQRQAHALCTEHRQGRRCGLHLRIGSPERVFGGLETRPVCSLRHEEALAGPHSVRQALYDTCLCFPRAFCS